MTKENLANAKENRKASDSRNDRAPCGMKKLVIVLGGDARATFLLCAAFFLVGFGLGLVCVNGNTGV